MTDQERAWLMRGLESLPTGEYQGGGKWVEVATNKVKPVDEPINSAFWLQQIDGLTVVGQGAVPTSAVLSGTNLFRSGALGGALQRR